ncbi:MAG TPA: HDIG domain-containing protein, partial [Myxococcales bacterium]|nr:HDIG domain-containing protein [Myxococcales bacterium]
MSVQDAIAHPPLPGRARRFRVRYFLVRTLLVVLLLALVALLPGAQGGQDQLRYHEGDIARERVVAPYDFRIEKDEPELRREQAIAAKAVTPVYSVDQRASSDMLARYAEFQDSVLRVLADPSLRATERTERLRNFNVPLSLETARALSSPSRARRMLVMLGPWLHNIYDVDGVVDEKNGDLIQGYRTISLQSGESEQARPASLFTDRRSALARLQQRAANALGEDPIGMRAIAEIAAPFVQTNIAYNRNETDWRRLQARAAVPTTIGIVKKDELLVDANQKITREALLKLRSLHNLESARRDPNEALYPPMTRVLLMLLLIAAFGTYLRMELPAVFRDNAMLAMLALLAAVTLTAAWLLVGVFGFSEFSVPIALAPLVVASLLEKRPALVYSMLLAVAVAAVNEFKAPQVAVAVLGGVTAVYSVSRLRHRWHFVRALFTLMAANVGGIMAWDLAHATTATLGRDAAWGVVNAFFSVSLAYMLLPVVENLFGLTSDITLLELSDLNRPLLRRLQLEAPGTYHHSMVVGSLAEAGTESIGANSLLARVSAYYHDIGKLSKSEYYAENEPVTSRSRHERLAPS